MPGALTKQELEAWRNFRYMVEETSLSVSRALFSATGMSGGQFGILSILAEAPKNTMRQQELADAMRWDRTRLSHVLTRMQSRGWIKRIKVEREGTLILLGQAGKAEQQNAAPVLARIVKERFLNRLSQVQLDSLKDVQRALNFFYFFLIEVFSC